VSDQSSDPVVRSFREQISENDLALLDALNRRLTLVRQLHDYKRAKGYDIIDAAREDWVLAWVSRSNGGPLSDEAVRGLWPTILELTTRETRRLQDAGAEEQAS
jgi:chorismate mutase